MLYVIRSPIHLDDGGHEKTSFWQSIPLLGLGLPLQEIKDVCRDQKKRKGDILIKSLPIVKDLKGLILKMG